ncbi:DUF4912 domain-containing protein [Pedosphaera parvula]|uniref:DUF4912 domain-containing protein n=1 Tax=Pedosphaera parvula (strain Ellin514) TaxID=320771 RepID=B9XGY5_PEDPL|nr:DUF4912 domain-containing protein [Pedosphaera parvula]EEF60906.1 conserved hypothetical protein [Pedosphaera parvula Ellin514]
MKSDKSSFKKVVKKVTKSIQERSAAVASKLKATGKVKTAAPEKVAAATSKEKEKAKSVAKPKTAAKTPPPVPIPENEKPPVLAKLKKKVAAKKALKIPAILLEGDQPTIPAPTGPGQRYALGPVPPPVHLGGVETAGELPEAYGTQQLLLAARDPHWLYARWDLTREQQRKYNALSVDRHLIVKVFMEAIKGEPISIVHVHPESNHWFVPVEQAGKKYLAQLGYFQPDGKWVTISTSGATLTPPDTMSEDVTAQFATIPIDIPFTQLVEMAKEAVRLNVPLTEVVRQLKASGYQIPMQEGTVPVMKWTAEQERALSAIITMDKVRRVWMGSLEITELIRRQLQQEISSMGVMQLGQPTSPVGAITSVSSPFGGVQRGQKSFWFNVNAELIIYGATEPDATVTIGGRRIKLRPDGSFSYRFALPDGKYNLPAMAISADQTDGRAADLSFGRSTAYRGEVGKHPQDPALKPPLVENVS